jgi:serine/threonine protein kinase
MNDPLSVGTSLHDSRYVVRALYKRGGQALVYKGYDVEGDEEVIIKETEQARNQAALQEAELLSDLDHASLPHVIDCFEEAGSIYLITKYVDGIDLDELLESRGGPFTVEEVFDWAIQLLSILKYLQERETLVVHRDINPKNIRVTPDNRLFLLDFGIAKKLSQKTLLVGGTPHYAPPEQLKDEGTDQRSDIYSLSATLYFLLTAVEPPDALSRSAAVLKGSSDPLIEAHRLNSKIPVHISHLLDEGMSLDREMRPNSAAVFRHKLENPQEPSETNTEVSQRIPYDSETTDVTARDVSPNERHGRMVIALDQPQKTASNSEAQEFMNAIHGGLRIESNLVQVILELLESQPSVRPKIVKRYRALLHRRTQDDSRLALNLINRLVSSTVDRQLEVELRRSLSQILNTRLRNEQSKPPEVSEYEKWESESQKSLHDFQLSKEHGAWLKQFVIWILRGSLIAIAIKLLTFFITGNHSLIQLLPLKFGYAIVIANAVLIAFTVALLFLVRRIAAIDRYEREQRSPIYFVVGLGYGLILFDVVAYDVLGVISALIK